MSTGSSSDPTLCWLLNCLIKEKMLTWEFFDLYNKYDTLKYVFVLISEQLAVKLFDLLALPNVEFTIGLDGLT